MTRAFIIYKLHKTKLPSWGHYNELSEPWLIDINIKLKTLHRSPVGLWGFGVSLACRSLVSALWNDQLINSRHVYWNSTGELQVHACVRACMCPVLWLFHFLVKATEWQWSKESILSIYYLKSRWLIDLNILSAFGLFFAVCIVVGIGSLSIHRNAECEEWNFQLSVDLGGVTLFLGFQYWFIEMYAILQYLLSNIIYCIRFLLVKSMNITSVLCHSDSKIYFCVDYSSGPVLI